ncbi:hypothetical protein ACIRSS_23790 [Amycolatopsis sp. NPDC101161]|uniref:hypothetical protein n=1 Tax=Amycolatopsis sp. NPDC101161 TaxID=3363940 RepID=UPI00381E8BE7
MTTPPSVPPAAGGPGEPPFMSLRTLLILLVGFVFGVVSGFLTFLAYRNVAGAVLAGLGTAGAAIAVLNGLIG